ncbi:unnamed protein product [[Candida] boidinii]|uniref:Unnamed protein product n=1 Tax=Candida boidinii TaxID=5477 RepID=A0A9W6WIL8_CANBO|nr:hypothetical protein B5S30_g3711 [[Candida] boidinii]GME73789.1 unnamed protein product [[Candida] boidinii]GMF98999.1 unnamed protein product [[Candida] boidinii]
MTLTRIFAQNSRCFSRSIISNSERRFSSFNNIICQQHKKDMSDVLHEISQTKKDITIDNKKTFESANGLDATEFAKNEDSRNELKKSEENTLEDEEDEYVVDYSQLEKRWLKMKPEDQLMLIDDINTLQTFSWKFLTKDQKKAIYYISYGQWGPRTQENLNIPELIFKIFSSSILFGVVGFAIVNYAIDKEKVQEIEETEAKQALLQQNEPATKK